MTILTHSPLLFFLLGQGMMAMVQPTGLSLLTTAWKMMRGAGDNKEQNPQPVASIV